MKPLLFFGLILCLAFPSTAFAAGDDLVYEANKVGGSGWDIYGDDDLDEEELEAERRKEEEARARAEEERQAKTKRRSDFFSLGVDVYDKSLSRTAKEEKKLKRVK